MKRRVRIACSIHLCYGRDDISPTCTESFPSPLPLPYCPVEGNNFNRLARSFMEARYAFNKRDFAKLIKCLKNLEFNTWSNYPVDAGLIVPCICTSLF